MSIGVSLNATGPAGSSYAGAIHQSGGKRLQKAASMRILLADDHGMVRDTMSAYLESEGRAAVVAVADYHEAMKMLAAKGPFDLVLLDFNMPGMNGLDGLSGALKAHPDQLIAILSGSAPNRIAQEAVERGAIGYLPKSMAGKSLVNAVRFMDIGRNLCSGVRIG